MVTDELPKPKTLINIHMSVRNRNGGNQIDTASAHSYELLPLSRKSDKTVGSARVGAMHRNIHPLASAMVPL